MPRIRTTLQHLTLFFILVTLSAATTTNATAGQQHRVWLKYESGHHATVAKDLPETGVHYHFQEVDAFVVSGTADDIERWRAHPRILNVEEDVLRYRFGHSTVRQRQRRREQLLWDNQAAGYGFSMIQADVLQRDYGLTGESITICVPDSGVDATHEDLDASMLSGDQLATLDLPWDIDAAGHGTFIAGIIAAQDNGIGLIGVAPKAKIHSINIFDDQETVVYVSAVVESLRLCRDAGVQIASLSLGGPVFSVFEFDMLNDMYENYGILSIAASGNSGDNTDFYPASYRHVISVGSINEVQSVSEFSTGNAMVDLVAPGQAIWSTLPQNFDCEFCENLATSTYGSLEGTSFACPQVAGIAALLWSEDTSVGVDYIYNALLASALDLEDTGRDTLSGEGLVQGVAAYEALHATLNGTQTMTFAGGACPSGFLGLRVAILTDQYSFEETYWEVVRNSDNFTAISRSGLLGNTQYIDNACLPEDCYTFYAYDTGGDGICCISGQGTLEVSVDRKVILDSDFTTETSSVDFGGECTTFPVDQKDPCTNFQMNLRTDEYPEEISVLIESVAGEVWWNDLFFADQITDYSLLECLDPSLCYRFTLFDQLDCLYSPGNLELTFGDEVLFSGLPEFRFDYFVIFGDGCATAAPTVSPTEVPTDPPTLAPNAIVPETPIDSTIGGISNETMASLIDAIVAGTMSREAEPEP